MSYVYTGNSRSLKVTVTKFVNGVPQTPITYPTATDIANGFFTYSGGVVNIPPPEELAQMDESSYAALLIAFQTYVQESNPGLNFATATISVPAVVTNDPNCPVPGTPVVPVTTTTTTPEAPVTTTTTESEYSISVMVAYNGELGGTNGLGGTITIDGVGYVINEYSVGHSELITLPEGSSCNIDACSVLYYKNGSTLQPVFGYTINEGTPQSGCSIDILALNENKAVLITLSEST